MQTTNSKSYEEIATWFIDRVAEHAELPQSEISAELPLANYGLDSVQAVSLSVDIEDAFGLVTPPTLVWDYPTIDKLARYVVSELSAIPQPEAANN